MKKKIIAVLVALVLAITCAISVNAADTIIGNGSGQLTPFFADFDPSNLVEMVQGLDFGGILNDLGMGDLGGLLGNFDISSLLGGSGGGIGDLLGNLDLGNLLGGLGGGGNSGGDDTTAAPDSSSDTTAAPSSSSTTAPTSGSGNNTATTAPVNSIPKTGDAGISAFAALAIAAGAAFVFTRKKGHEAE